MSKVFTKSGFVVSTEANKITPLSDSTKEMFNRLWIWPASAIVGAKRVENVGDIYLGERTESGDVTPDVIGASDMPTLIELPQGENKMLRDVIFQSNTAGDGVFFKYW